MAIKHALNNLKTIIGLFLVQINNKMLTVFSEYILYKILVIIPPKNEVEKFQQIYLM